ncbi:MAG TPA: hypothetical protein VFG34_09835 [Sphingopyxis sp.]|nr:hypothetical protein [Sphingopyxis sp.]
MKRTRLSICAKKLRYADEQEAMIAALRASITLRPYRCDRCGLFHLTSRTKGKRLDRRQIPMAPSRSEPSLSETTPLSEPPSPA